MVQTSKLQASGVGLVRDDVDGLNSRYALYHKLRTQESDVPFMSYPSHGAAPRQYINLKNPLVVSSHFTGDGDRGQLVTPVIPSDREHLHYYVKPKTILTRESHHIECIIVGETQASFVLSVELICEEFRFYQLGFIHMSNTTTYAAIAGETQRRTCTTPDVSKSPPQRTCPAGWPAHLRRRHCPHRS